MTAEHLETAELDDVIERAHDELEEREFEQALVRAEEEGAHAGQRLVGAAIVTTLLGGVLAVAVIGNALWLMILPLLFLFYAIPAIAASQVAADRDTERESLVRSIEAHELRAGSGKKRLA